MSLTGFDDTQRVDVAHLQHLLHKREYHLAELINEVVFAEQERYKAVQEAHGLRELTTRLEGVVNKLLEYNITIHREVLLPVLIDSVRSNDDARSVGASPVEDSTAVGSSKDCIDDLLLEPCLSSETKRLLQAVVKQRRKAERQSSGHTRLHVNVSSPSAAPSGSAARIPPVDAEASVTPATRRAIVLSDSLLQSQESLAQLLHTIQAQARDLLRHWNELGGNELQDRQQPLRESTVRRQKSTSEVAPFRLENLHQRSCRVREIEEALRSVEGERDALQAQLRERDATADAAAVAASAQTPAAQPDESWLKEKAQLEKELAYAQQRVLQEQARSQELKKQVSQLEKIAAASPITPFEAISSSWTNCEKMQEEIKNITADYHAAKTAWKAEEQRLQKEIASLRLQAKEPVNDASLPSASPPVSGSVGAPPYCAPGTETERKVGRLEALVAALKADLQIMETRMSIAQNEWCDERRRILTAHERERQRLLDEKSECQTLIDKMSRELQSLSRISASAPPAITSIAG
ncbi:hypothetical protein GH5_01264 [Leishmania sp. Ghana 2012 LV757]|uniref:hypothetical protein n=1 Tax=Leishmania sp. Ghana 2012 LV757 TaxID=2803181 RepID=UPI001B582785|nr:hypothetical protein GH5_01264 [Leishmania sp. Ghana 2012 LV757]